MDINMLRRISVAVVAIPAVVIIVWAGSWPLTLLLIAATVLGTLEFYRLAELTGTRPLRGFGVSIAALWPLALQLMLTVPALHSWFSNAWVYLVLLLILVALTLTVFTRSPDQHPLAAAAVTLLGLAYATLLPSTLFLIRHTDWPPRSWTGTELVFFPLVVVWVCDSAAMFGGRAIGGPRLAPAISPGKTRAGALAGVLGGTAIGALYAAWLFPRAGIAMSVATAAGLALLLSVIGQIGDLAESLIKREAGVKDSSSLIPGHGGVLDRLDSLYFVIPAAAIAYHFLGLM